MRRVENRKQKKARKAKAILLLIKLTIYFILVVASYLLALRLASYFIKGLEYILSYGLENITKVFYGIILLLVTKMYYFKRPNK